MTLLEAANQYTSYGISCIPIGRDKKPIGKWGAAIHEVLAVDSRFNSCTGIGIVCGKVSGNLVCIDFDPKYQGAGTDCWDDFKHLIKEKNLSQTIKSCFIESSPSGGRHVLYRIYGEALGSEKLASRWSTKEELLIEPNLKKRAFIETRGEGGYVQVHPTKEYELLNGSMGNLPVLSMAEHEAIMNVCKSFDSTDAWVEKIVPARIDFKVQGDTPFEDYQNRGDVPALLEEYGWELDHIHENVKMRYLRAGKKKGQGHSADWHIEKRIFYVFTSNSEFEPNRGYNAAQVFTILNYGVANEETYRTAAKELLLRGYGKKLDENEIKKTVADDRNYLADIIEIDANLDKWISGNYEMGVGIGCRELDRYFVYKKGELNVINGLSYVGKTWNLLWWQLALSVRHGFKWIIFCVENEDWEIVKKLIEWKEYEYVRYMNADKFKSAKAWVYEHFTIISNERPYTYKNVLDIIGNEISKKPYAGTIIDPYQRLQLDRDELKGLGKHDYNLNVSINFQTFVRRTKHTLYVTMHPNTNAGRTRDFGSKDNKDSATAKMIAPTEHDTEGGSLWMNASHNFLTLHRHYNNHDLKHITEWHIRKIKTIETGGSRTVESFPTTHYLESGLGFCDRFGYNPVNQRVREEQEMPPF